MTERKGPSRIGVVGCGNISTTYLRHAPDFGLEVTAVADLDPARAWAAAERFDVPHACTTEDLLAREDVDVVLNLTIPAAHVEVAQAAIAAGKHVYSEKPLAVTRDDGDQLMRAAAASGLRVGSAPDTFLGVGIQTCRSLIDSGAIGTPVAGTAFMAGHGHEHWHPAPEFYYRPGGGPLFDMGPYYLTALVSLLGPVRRVSSAARASFPERTIGSGPRAGDRIQVEVETHIAGSLEFVAGPIVTLLMSFDVWAANLPFFEIYGSEGTISGPDPNGFGGPVHLWQPDHREWAEATLHSNGRPQTRGLGLADLVDAIGEGRPHRASGEMAFHVLDIMCALIESAEGGHHVTLTSTCERPAPLL